MRAILVHVSEEQLRERRTRGLDRSDEMWEGVLHMVPPASFDHQDLLVQILAFLHAECRSSGAGGIWTQVGLFDPADPGGNYRVPDLAFVGAGNEGVLEERGIVGPADSVIEVRSPGDESYEKLPFFCSLGVREVVVIDRDTRKPEVFRLAGPQYLAVAPLPDGWVTAEVLRVRLRVAEGPRVRLESIDDPTRAVEA